MAVLADTADSLLDSVSILVFSIGIDNRIFGTWDGTESQLRQTFLAPFRIVYLYLSYIIK